MKTILFFVELICEFGSWLLIKVVLCKNTEEGLYDYSKALSNKPTNLCQFC